MRRRRGAADGAGDVAGADGYPDAADSLRKGLEEMLKVLKLALPPTLRRFFATTNCIENLIGTVRHVTRNIKRWRDGDMRRRWTVLLHRAPPSASGVSSGTESWTRW